MGESRGILVTGATSQIGQFLIPLLEARGLVATAVSRYAHPPGRSSRLRWVSMDLVRPVDWSPIGRHEAVIALTALPLLTGHLRGLAAIGVNRIVAFSTTSIWTKRESADPVERGLIESIVTAEGELIEAASALGMAWTLFRPTMIYGAGMDRNLSSIASFVQRFRCFPLAGNGGGLRQPVHAGDLAAACLDVLDNSRTFARAYTLTGGSTVTYREMVERVFHGLGVRPCIVHLPLPLLRMGVRLIRGVPRFRYLRAEMVNRMNTDLVFDSSEAKTDFGFSPRGLSL